MTHDLALAIVACAESHLGIRESSRNRGPLIDTWVERIGLDPAGAHPWCAAFAWCMIDDACKILGQPNPLQRSGKVARLWLKNHVYNRRIPKPGMIACHVVYPSDHLSPGHCSIVTAVLGAEFHGVEGNTNAQGSREGTDVARHVRDIGWANLGFLDPTA